MSRRPLACALAWALALGATEARAQAPSEPPAAPSPRRERPDYDGRGPRPTTGGEAALWGPRVLFFPAYAATEYLVRRPLGWLVSTAERKRWPALLVDFFTFGPEQNAGIIPTAFFDFGLNPSVGLYVWWDKAFVPSNSVRLHLGTWGPSWLLVSMRDRVQLSQDSTASVYGTFLRRPDNPFFGLGPRSLYENFSRFRSDLLEAGADAEVGFARWGRLSPRVGVRRREFDQGGCCDEPSLSEQVARGRLELPPGFASGYTAVFQRLELVLDSRPRRPAPQDGVRVSVELEQGQDASALPSGARWFRYGGTAAGYVDVGRTRTFGLKLTALFADPARGEVPFTEQVILGGLGPMRGYFFNRLIGRSAAVAELEYRWPVWVFLDGTVHVSTGNVFDAHLRDFSTDLLRLSAAIGLKSNNSADHQFELLTGFGTETLADGLRVTSFRLVFGGTRGF